MNIKHSILVVTYNQANFIQETISSLVNQTELPYEIIILDDCSIDDSWEIVLLNQKNYPQIIKAFRNDRNLGIFENIKKVRSLFSGEVVSFCSGDDLLEPNTVKSINEQIVREKLNGYNDKFIVVTNSVHLHPNGKRTIWNNYIERNIPPIKTRLRYGLSYRNVGLSKALLESTTPEADIQKSNLNVGYNADFFRGFEEITKAERIIFINENGGVYRLSVGVTSIKNEKLKWKTHHSAYTSIRDLYRDKFDKKDLLFIKFILAADQNKIDPRFNNWIKMFYYYFANTGNFSFNNPMVRNLHYLLPLTVVEFIKFRIFPNYLILRNKFIK
jgi:glycosyltransferase involved in cell wall biosynthesis